MTVKALINISDNLLNTSFGVPGVGLTNPDPNTYSIVDTLLSSIAEYETRQYRWNVKESHFYDAGLIDISGKDPARVTSTWFMDSAGHEFCGLGISGAVVADEETDIEITLAKALKLARTKVWIDTPTYGGVFDIIVKMPDPDNEGEFIEVPDKKYVKEWQIHPTEQNMICPGYVDEIPAGFKVAARVRLPFDAKFYANVYFHDDAT